MTAERHDLQNIMTGSSSGGIRLHSYSVRLTQLQIFFQICCTSLQFAIVAHNVADHACVRFLPTAFFR